MLALLGLFQSRSEWSRGRARAAAPGHRPDRPQRHRPAAALGYPVDAVRGPGGRYRLGVGTKLPPLLLEEDEAVAVAVGLRAGTGVERHRGDQRPSPGQAGGTCSPIGSSAGSTRSAMPCSAGPENTGPTSTTRSSTRPF